MKDIIAEDKKWFSQVYNSEPVVFESGEGVYLKDVQGRMYLDFSAQFSACSLGHDNRDLIEALTDQMNRLISVSPMFVTQERVELARILAELAPSGLTKSLFGCTGSDANEFALKAAKYYRSGGKIISFWRGYHGATAGSAGATGKLETIQIDRSISELLPRGFIHAAPPYCYRCDFGRSYPGCDLFCLKFLETQIKHEGENHIAAIIIEPIQASGGIIVPPDEYLPELRKLCDTYNILLIFDEVVTGIGRIGKMFACQHWNVVPDILVIGKALTGGYIPGSAVLMKSEIGAVMDNLILHGHTHSAYPLMCAAARKNLELIIRQNICESVENVGNYLKEKLLELKAEIKEIGDVRGVGLLQGIEIVKDPEIKEPDYALGRAVFKDLLNRGLIVELESFEYLNNCVIVLHPPLTIHQEHIDQAIDILHRSFLKCTK